ncbi:50S ribosomal protein L16 [Candidatus Shapirobacteria bacterium CG09_land_8_20_14_0_10_39_12]|uniref:50S ribosomal protein L16 n=1 Tax=Candidatus Shapirobacteria bacterium CG09_land_8_20_14_0_10_39_12 TaxID=1974885 RepID=A0A2H0WP73_9BACT|nr:MAG: 50S ribosomal protein L16 [Candidatus Shapirobacteria bacterium CG09_land_8_20_14_0_10_39_12]
MLAPKRQKYRKTFRGKNRGVASRGSQIDFGKYGLKAMVGGLVSAAEIEAARKAISHFTEREGKVWIRIFPDKPITAKAEGRMGAGKGDVKGFVVVVKPGKILFELAGVTELVAREAFQRASSKLSVKTKFLEKKEW